MLLEDSDRSRSPVKVIQPHFAVFPEFKSASYRDRYAILVEKLLRDRLYDAHASWYRTAPQALTAATSNRIPS